MHLFLDFSKGFECLFSDSEHDSEHLVLRPDPSLIAGQGDICVPFSIICAQSRILKFLLKRIFDYA